METIKNKETLIKKEDIINALIKELKNRFKIDECRNFKHKQVEQTFFYEKGESGRICFAHHYEPGIDILINDCKFNALGMICVFHEDSGDKKSNGTCDTFLKSCIDKACYIRHLLIRNAEIKNEGNKGKNNNKNIQARCVELILVCPESLKVEFGKTLRKIAVETDYLNYIGVNLLPISESEEKIGEKRTKESERNRKYFKEKDLDQAFSWLLRKTREWYAEISPNNNALLRKITLKNYRLPGERIINLEPGRTVHLIHGHNGSGKSSIVEALEIAVTGSSERLCNIHDYDEVIRNKYSEKPAYVNLLFDGIEEKEFKINKKGISEPLETDIKATSFRLDQDVMERLTRAGRGERANVFINAFFPKDRDVVENYDIAQKKADEYFKKLPQKLQDFIRDKKMSREDAVIDVLAVLENEKDVKTIELLEACFPHTLSILREVIPLFPGLSGALESLASGLLNENILNQVDKALNGIMGHHDKFVYALQKALGLLKQLSKWQVSSHYAPDFKTTLDKWMEMTALTDLVEKYYIVVKSLNEAHKRKWSMDKSIRQVFVQYSTSINDETIKEKLNTFASERDQLRSFLEPIDLQNNEEGMQVSIQPILSHSEMSILDQAGEWISVAGLGEKIKEALAKNQCIKFDESLTIGISNWAEPLIKKVEKLIGALEELSKNREKVEKNCVERYRDLHNTLQAFKEFKEIGEKIHTTFLKLLEKDKKINLIEVLNELMDLFTPARWAYEDIAVRHEFSNNKHQLHFEINDSKKGSKVKARADFRLNTAELNVFALSLFTLCAVRNPNPLSLLIFDDPLQNMDEITVTTLARGFNKLIKLFPKNWQILMLFHGQDDLERFCREIPAAVYSLPWLSPAAETEPIPIKPDTLKSQGLSEVQDLNDIVKIKL